MDKDLRQFIEKVKKINLSREERTTVKRSVLNFISQNPVRPDIQSSFSYESMVPILSKSLIWLQNRGSAIGLRPIGTILLILAVLVSGGAAIGAEKSLPGDPLYSMNVGFNEEVRGWLSISEEAKANWEVERAQRRLEEAEELATDGSLSVEVRENIEANFEAHAERVKDRIGKFESKENLKAAADVSSKFETSLRAHQKILKRLSVESEEEVKKEIKPIEVKVRSEANVLIRKRKKMELRVNNMTDIGAGSAQEDDLEIEDETDLDLNLNLEGETIKTDDRIKVWGDARELFAD